MTIQDIQIVRGDTLELEIKVIDETGRPVDLSGSKVFFTVKLKAEDPDEQAAIQVVQQQHAAPLAGTTFIEVDQSKTSLLSPRRSYVYDIQLVKDGKVYTIAMGNLKVIQDITERVD